MTQNIIKALVALGVVVVIALGGYALLHGGQSFGGSAYEALPKWFGNGLSAGLSQQFAVDNAGQVTSAATTNTTAFWTVNGVDYASVQVSMAATSSVPCSIPNPFGATALVLDHITQVTTNGIGSAQLLDVSTSSTAYASSSPAFVKRYSAGASTFTLPWQPGVGSTTRAGLLGYDSFSAAGSSPFILGASEYLNTGIATGTPGTFASYYTGTCSATFMKP